MIFSMVYDSAATRARLLDAAYAEFAARGFAGARVASIATVAGANKQAIYLYFGSKEGLFDAVLEDRLGILGDQVPYTPDSFAEYIGALFDHLVEHVQLARLHQWKALERPETTGLQAYSHISKAEALAHQLGVNASTGMDIFMLALSMAQAWTMTSDVVRSIGEDPASRLREHRDTLIFAVSAVIEKAAITSQ